MSWPLIGRLIALVLLTVALSPSPTVASPAGNWTQVQSWSAVQSSLTTPPLEVTSPQWRVVVESQPANPGPGANPSIEVTVYRLNGTGPDTNRHHSVRPVWWGHADGERGGALPAGHRRTIHPVDRTRRGVPVGPLPALPRGRSVLVSPGRICVLRAASRGAPRLPTARGGQARAACPFVPLRILMCGKPISRRA